MTSALDVVGDFAIMGMNTNGLRVIDVSDREAPQVVATFAMPGKISGIDVQGNFAFIANDTLGLRIVDWTNPLDPVEVAHYRSGHIADDVEAHGDVVYLANRGQIFVLDVSEALGTRRPAAPEQLIVRLSENGNSIVLDWFPVTTDLNGRPIEIDRYEIYRRNSSNNEWVNIGIPTPQTATEYTFPVPRGGYSFAEFYVRAVQQ